MDKYSLWRKNWPEGIPTASPLPYGRRPIADYLKKHAELTPDKIAISFYGREITFREWDESADRLAAALADLGYEKGDRVALFTQNSPQFCIAYIAAARLGLIIFPVDVMSKEYELEYTLKDAQAKLVIALDQVYPVVRKVRERAEVKDVIVTSLWDYLPGKPALPLHKMMTPSKQTFPDTLEFLDLLQRCPSASPEASLALDEAEVVLYTGGTTGPPKGCPHTHEDVLMSGAHAAYVRECGRDRSPCKSVLCFLPLSHIGGLSHSLFPACVAGRAVIMLTRYDPITVMQAIEKYQVEAFNATVPLYEELLGHPAFKEYDLSSLKLCMAGEWMVWVTPDLSRRWEETVGLPIVKWGYGTGTEVANVMSVGTRIGYELPFKDAFMMGTVLPDEGIDLRVVDFDTSEELPAGQQGEIVIKSPALIKHYWRRLEETKKAITDDGWLYTGDIGKLDEEGYVYWYGRRQHLIRVSGYQVSPSEVEMIGRRNPDISNIVVVGVPDEKRGESPKAFVELRSGSKATEAELEEWFQEHISAYKVPRVEIRPQLPVTRKGSIDMNKLSEI